ncbi:MAG: NHLP bacteriocin export ABC transporter permease/ATPase subunit [Oscillospiraceae bacterium]|nr:NHLP bacteriocin export ABC transporter permease/ATPase subunit [Oscillospiraceae bacterium]
MGWFDEQIRQRKENDQELFQDSFVRLAGVVLGTKAASDLKDGQLVTKAAIEEILKYYHFKAKEIPAAIKNPDEQLEYQLRPHGIMRRNIKLEEGWYKDAYGPILAFMKDSGAPVALLPRGLTGYYYKDFENGKRVVINRHTAATLSQDAICFYQPLPLKALKIPDLFLYMKDCIRLGDVALVVIATVVIQLINLLIPMISWVMTGRVLESKNTTLLAGIAVFMICTSLSFNLISAVQSLINGRMTKKISMNVEAATMMRILALPATFFRKYSAGELSSRSQSIGMLCNTLLGSVMMTGLTSVTSLLSITQIFRYAPMLVAPSLLMILATVAFSVISSLMQMKITKKMMEHGALENGMSYALITGVQKIKLAGAEKRAFSRWAKLYSQGAELEYNPPMFLKINTVINMGLTLVGNIVMYYLACKSGISAADYMAFNAAYASVMGAFSALAGIALTVAEIPPVLDMAKPIMETEPEVTDGKEVLTRISGTIELNNVSFRYTPTSPNIVDNMSLKIRAGEYIAIVGRTGCGKSTLMRLLLGFEKPNRGAIYYDGKDMSRIDLRSLRRKIGAVTQNGSLFQGDIFSNITISAPELTLDAAWEAAEMAGIADDIRDMPMGMHTVISEGQGGISGGQKQRLMIARAVAPKPKILMFDEATSALDNKTQKQVSDALDKLKCTRIVIAHRLSTIRHCDRILLLDGGRILEDGSYDELIAKGGHFAELVERQRLDT